MFFKSRKNSMNYFVSIGAGINQIPLILEARHAGFQVIGVDMNPSAPGFYHCDLKIQESIQDYENIYIKLRELLIDGRISAVMTKSFGDAIVTTGFLCEKFGLPFLPFDECKKFLNKRVTRQLITESGIRMPEIITYKPKSKSGGIKKELFPVVVKPFSGHAKQNVLMIDSPDELDAFFKTNSPADFIIEKYVRGDEIICAGVIQNGRYSHVAMSDKKTTSRPHFVDTMHLMPSRYAGFADETIKTGQALADIFRIDTAPVIMEFLVDREGQLHLIEAIPEFGGEFIPDIMIPASTGYNHIGSLISAVTGSNFSRPSRRSTHSPVVVKYITGTEGTLASFSIDKVKSMENILFTRIFKHIGDRVSLPVKNHDRLGVIVARGKTIEAAIASAESAEKEMNIRIRHD
ncbi:MAG: ATP-grasp domain-containing protein [Spirochaetes bacterium]|nr:ATP-grasp domain-containing protein [Spirochaetota bacterium]